MVTCEKGKGMETRDQKPMKRRDSGRRCNTKVTSERLRENALPNLGDSRFRVEKLLAVMHP